MFSPQLPGGKLSHLYQCINPPDAAAAIRAVSEHRLEKMHEEGSILILPHDPSKDGGDTWLLLEYIGTTFQALIGIAESNDEFKRILSENSKHEGADPDRWNCNTGAKKAIEYFSRLQNKTRLANRLGQISEATSQHIIVLVDELKRLAGALLEANPASAPVSCGITIPLTGALSDVVEIANDALATAVDKLSNLAVRLGNRYEWGSTQQGEIKEGTFCLSLAPSGDTRPAATCTIDQDEHDNFFSASMLLDNHIEKEDFWRVPTRSKLQDLTMYSKFLRAYSALQNQIVPLHSLAAAWLIVVEKYTALHSLASPKMQGVDMAAIAVSSSAPWAALMQSLESLIKTIESAKTLGTEPQAALRAQVTELLELMHQAVAEQNASTEVRTTHVITIMCETRVKHQKQVNKTLRTIRKNVRRTAIKRLAKKYGWSIAEIPAEEGNGKKLVASPPFDDEPIKIRL